jgi:hypothetical protein
VNLALNGVDNVDLRMGSFFEPVLSERGSHSSRAR